MGLTKAIMHGKEHREMYRGSKAFDRACRNHGSCDWCRNGRTFGNRKRETIAKEKVKNYLTEWQKSDILITG